MYRSFWRGCAIYGVGAGHGGKGRPRGVTMGEEVRTPTGPGPTRLFYLSETSNNVTELRLLWDEGLTPDRLNNRLCVGEILVVGIEKHPDTIL